MDSLKFDSPPKSSKSGVCMGTRQYFHLVLPPYNGTLPSTQKKDIAWELDFQSTNLNTKFCIYYALYYLT